MPGSVAQSHVEDILVCPTQRWTFAAGCSRALFRNRNEVDHRAAEGIGDRTQDHDAKAQQCQNASRKPERPACVRGEFSDFRPPRLGGAPISIPP